MGSDKRLSGSSGVRFQFILYVASQQQSSNFYKKVLCLEPVLDVPGMTEFLLTPETKLGILPESGIRRILSNHTPDPAAGSGIPRCELYLYVNSPSASLETALHAGAKEIEKARTRDWGDEVAYCADPDGHVLAFAKKV